MKELRDLQDTEYPHKVRVRIWNRERKRLGTVFFFFLFFTGWLGFVIMSKMDCGSPHLVLGVRGLLVVQSVLRV